MNMNAHPYYVIDTDVLLKNPAIFTEIEAGALIISDITISHIEEHAHTESDYRTNAQNILPTTLNLCKSGKSSHSAVLSMGK